MWLFSFTLVAKIPLANLYHRILYQFTCVSRMRRLTSLILANDQLDAKLFYFIIRLLQSSTCFEQRRAHLQEVKLH